jgi:hypothetical protein
MLTERLSSVRCAHDGPQQLFLVLIEIRSLLMVNKYASARTTMHRARDTLDDASPAHMPRG